MAVAIIPNYNLKLCTFLMNKVSLLFFLMEKMFQLNSKFNLKLLYIQILFELECIIIFILSIFLLLTSIVIVYNFCYETFEFKYIKTMLFF